MWSTSSVSVGRDAHTGWHFEGHARISVDLGSGLPEGLVFDLCDASYEFVLAKSPKRVQQEISNE